MKRMRISRSLLAPVALVCVAVSMLFTTSWTSHAAPALSQAAAPTNTSSYTIYGTEWPTIEFTETLYDSTPGAVIYWQVSGCSGSVMGSSPLSSGDSFMLEYQSEFNCNPSGTMYATAPGYSQSPTVPIYF